MEKLPAAETRPIVSTVGAGDALFACFLHCLHKGWSPMDALHEALLFASYMMGTAGGAEGFLTGRTYAREGLGT
jgi:ribokinase